MSKKRITKEKFAEYCLDKAKAKILKRFFSELRELKIPLAMKIMEKEMGNFKII